MSSGSVELAADVEVEWAGDLSSGGSYCPPLDGSRLSESEVGVAGAEAALEAEDDALRTEGRMRSGDRHRLSAGIEQSSRLHQVSREPLNVPRPLFNKKKTQSSEHVIEHNWLENERENQVVESVDNTWLKVRNTLNTFENRDKNTVNSIKAGRRSGWWTEKETRALFEPEESNF